MFPEATVNGITIPLYTQACQITIASTDPLCCVCTCPQMFQVGCHQLEHSMSGRKHSILPITPVPRFAVASGDVMIFFITHVEASDLDWGLSSLSSIFVYPAKKPEGSKCPVLIPYL